MAAYRSQKFVPFGVPTFGMILKPFGFAKMTSEPFNSF